MKPKKPYLEWTKLDDETGVAPRVSQSMHEEPAVYLLPEYEDGATQQDLSRELWEDLLNATARGLAPGSRGVATGPNLRRCSRAFPKLG